MVNLNAPDLAWTGAFYYWWHAGDNQVIVRLLREGKHLSSEHASILASILDGTIQPRGVRGGPSYKVLQFKRNIDFLYIYPLFRRALRVYQWRSRRRPELRMSPRAEAYEYVSRWLTSVGMPMTSSAVKKRVERGLSTEKEDAEFRETMKRGAEKKLPEEK